MHTEWRGIDGQNVGAFAQESVLVLGPKTGERGTQQ